MVTNADTWLGSGIGQVLNTATPALSVVRAENSERYGSLRIEQDRVVAFREKQQSSGPGWINAGLYHLQPEFFRDWDGMPFSLERGLFPKLAATGQLRAVPLETDFIDIGIPEDYIRFCRWVESDKMRVL
jgi:NDP-sugar pyrophosphorylase family protein